MAGSIEHGADERRAWLAIGFLGLVTLLALKASGFTVEWATTAVPIGGALLLCGAARFYRSIRPEQKISATCEALAQIIMLTMMAGPLSYAVATLDLPLQDGHLAAADAALGLDWRAYFVAAGDRPAVAAIFKLAYDTLLPQLAAALLLLGFSGRLSAARVLVWAVGLSAVTTILISALLPATGYYVHLALTPADLARVSPSAAFVHMPDFMGLRDGTDRTIDLRSLQGIITFPSFHAALATLYGWAFWQHRRARWIGLIFEGLVVLSTPIEGGHYFVDVAAGMLIAGLSILAAARITAARGLQASRHQPAQRNRPDAAILPA